ncbi:MAG: hypothetical protein EBU34_00625 [Alphaproteobacteria bacterium]|nr:hypothetical protein [Alphaproteobacteria bacterium]
MVNINHLNPFSDNDELRNNFNNINVISFFTAGAPILTHQIATKSQQVLELYGQGLGASAIADQLGISRASTYRIIGEMGSGEAK